MPPKFAQDKAERERTRDPNVPIQPHILTAAELPYRINAIPPSRAAQFSKASSSTVFPPTSASNYSIPYRQRLVEAALAAPPDDQQSSNDSSSAPSSNALSSGVGTSSVTSSSSHDTSKGKGKATVTDTAPAPVPFVPRNSPITPFSPTVVEATHLDPDASYFERLMDSNASTMPPPGLSYFEMRRVLWCTTPPIPPPPSSPAPSRIKLEALLSQPGAVESEEVWRAGLKNVWKGLVGGNQLRKRLPLHIVLKILQAGWLRDGTWPEGMAAPAWDQPISVSPPSTAPPDDLSQAHAQGQIQAQLQAQQQRRTHEQEAYAAALHARASAEQGHGAAQMHMQAYGMMGMQGGIPPGYSPSSGDAPEEGYYAMPYAYAEATPPPGGEGIAEGQMERMQNPEEMQDEGMREAERDDGPPPTPLRTGQEVESEMDTEDEVEEDDDGVVNMDDDSRTQGVVGTGDGRHEGG